MGKPIFSKPSVKVFKSTAQKQNFMVIGDIHEPYSCEDAIKFCVDTQELFNIPSENIFQVGDEIDAFAFGMYPKGADFPHTPNQEIELCQKRLKEWGKAFPLLKVCHSNHASRYWRKAAGGEMPTQVLRSYREVFGVPAFWEYNECYATNTKMPFLVFHGEGFAAPKMAAMHFGCSTAMGHLHSQAGINWINTAVTDMWAMNVGCLIDTSSFVFQYAKHAKMKPSIGVSVILDSGRCPIWIPKTF